LSRLGNLKRWLGEKLRRRSDAEPVSGLGWLDWFWVFLFGLGVLGVGAVIAFALVINHYSSGLPSVETLKSGYAPPQVSRIFAKDGTLLASVFTERRTVIPFEDIPDATKLAFLAAEDAHFYEHEGLNYFGVLRALYANARAGRTVQGGSTITQQVIKNVLLDRERSYVRKIRETILARRLEQSLTKDEIFWLYLNHIYLGHGRYGIEEAARYYFGKRAKELDAAESALLAGIVASPEHYSPRRSPEQALARRSYVLSQMLAKGFVTPDYYEDLKDAPLRLAPESEAESALCPEVVAVARQTLKKLGKDAASSSGGFTITTTIDPELEVAARASMRKALDDYATRHKLVPPFDSDKIKAWGKPFKGRPKQHGIYVGVVESTDDKSGRVRVRVGDAVGQVNLGDEERYNPKHLPASEFTKPGAVLRVRMLEAPSGDEAVPLSLEIGPQGALVAIDVRTREVVALVGSYQALPGALDRAQQARRQPGSSFKPLVWSYALHSHAYNPATLLTLEKPGRGVTGAPPQKLSVRLALAHSNNEASNQLLLAGGAANIVGWAHTLGIHSKLGADLSLALGSYEVTPLEMANTYATFASGGYLQAPRLIHEIKAPGGELLELPTPGERRAVMPAAEAYLITSLLKSVVSDGTGKAAQKVGHVLAGKTGTTNQVKDAWFVGYSTELAAAVWIGYDDGLPLGNSESGSHTALPAFVDFMSAALAGRPRTDFPRPPGIVVASIDPATGLLARPGQSPVLSEEFLDGTAPEEMAPEPQPDTTLEMTYKPGFPSESYDDPSPND
jgi:penicillin-binding protein 1A